MFKASITSLHSTPLLSQLQSKLWNSPGDTWGRSYRATYAVSSAAKPWSCCVSMINTPNWVALQNVCSQCMPGFGERATRLWRSHIPTEDESDFIHSVRSWSAVESHVQRRIVHHETKESLQLTQLHYWLQTFRILLQERSSMRIALCA